MPAVHFNSFNFRSQFYWTLNLHLRLFSRCLTDQLEEGSPFGFCLLWHAIPIFFNIWILSNWFWPPSSSSRLHLKVKKCNYDKMIKMHLIFIVPGTILDSDGLTGSKFLFFTMMDFPGSKFLFFAMMDFISLTVTSCVSFASCANCRLLSFILHSFLPMQWQSTVENQWGPIFSLITSLVCSVRGN